MSTGKEAEKAPEKERYPQRLITYREVQGIIADNRTTLILNTKSFRGHFSSDGSSFDPDLCHPIRLVDVLQYDGSIIKGIQDGNHRSIAGEIYGKRLDPDIPYLPTQNVTKQFSDKPLSPEHFMDVLIEPTKQQAEIAPERMAYITLSQWEQMVGPDIANKFSFLAALTDTARVEPYFVGSTPAEQKIVQKKLTALQDIIKKADYSPQEMRKEILLLMSQQGTDAVLEKRLLDQQIRGLMFLPSFNNKLTQAFGHDQHEELATGQEKTIQEVARSLARFTKKRENLEREKIYELLTKPSHPFRETIAIINAPSPKSAETHARIQKQVEKTKAAYQAKLPPGAEISSNANGLLYKFRERTETPETIAATVAKVTKILERADTILATLPVCPQRTEIENKRTSVKKHSTYDTIGSLADFLQGAINAAGAVNSNDEVTNQEDPRIRILEADNTRLTKQVTAFETANEALFQKAQGLQTENKRLTDREAELKAEIERLKRLLDKQVTTTTETQVETAPSANAEVTVFPANTVEPVTPPIAATDETEAVAVPAIWDTLRYHKEHDGTKVWFASNFPPPPATVNHEVRQKTTLMISDKSRMVLRYPPEEWPETLSNIQLQTGQTGLDAIDHALTPRFGRLMHDLAWGITNEEFSYLAGASIIQFLKASAEDIPETDPRKANSIRQTIEIMTENLHAFKALLFDKIRAPYAVLIQVLLFGHPNDQARKTIIGSMRGARANTISTHDNLIKLASLHDPRIKTHKESDALLGKLFRRHILGEKPTSLSSPEPDTSR